MNDSIVRKYEYQGGVRNYFQKLIDEHNKQVDDYKKFIVRNVTVTDNNDYITRANENYPSTKNELNEKLLDSLGGHFEIEEINGIRYIDYLEEYEKVNNQNIIFGKNLLDLSEYITAEGIATRIIGLGNKNEETGDYLTFASINNGKDYVEDKSAIALFGTITDTVNFDDVTVKSNLLAKTKKYLESRITSSTTINLNATDLHAIDVNIEALRVGRMTRVISKPHNLDKYFLLSKITLNLDDLKSSTIVLGKTGRTFTEQQIAQENSVTIAQLDILKQAKANATYLIKKFNGGCVVKKDGELYISDNEDLNEANHLWRWNLNGFAYSENGIEGPYKTAITMNGAIVADFITAGILRGLQITNGNNFSVDKQGNMTAKSGSIGGFNLDSTKFSSDFNGIYKYTMEDYAICMDYIRGNATLDSEQINLYDTNGDGKVDIVDVVNILNVIKGNKEATKNVSGSVEISSNTPKELFKIKNSRGETKTAISLFGIHTPAVSTESISVKKGETTYPLVINKSGINSLEYDGANSRIVVETTAGTKYISIS